MPTPNPYRQPRTRAEAIAPLEQVKQACEEDPGYLASVARIIADVLDQANSVAEPAPPRRDRRGPGSPPRKESRGASAAPPHGPDFHPERMSHEPSQRP